MAVPTREELKIIRRKQFLLKHLERKAVVKRLREQRVSIENCKYKGLLERTMYSAICDKLQYYGMLRLDGRLE